MSDKELLDIPVFLRREYLEMDAKHKAHIRELEAAINIHNHQCTASGCEHWAIKVGLSFDTGKP